MACLPGIVRKENVKEQLKFTLNSNCFYQLILISLTHCDVHISCQGKKVSIWT